MKWMLTIVFTLNFITMNAQQYVPTNDTLNKQQQSLVAISALTATGRIEALKPQLINALDTGVTVNEIKEALVQLYAYCGFPRSLNAINTFRTVLNEREAKGIHDEQGKPIIA